MSAYRMGLASASAYTALKAQGMRFIDKPGDEIPAIPEDLTSLDDQTLMQVYARFVAWAEYAASQCSCAAIDEKNAERRALSLERKEQLALRAQGHNVTDARNTAKDSEAVSKAFDEHFAAEAYRRLVESVATSVDRAAALISRELTRRTGASAEKSRRQGNWLT